jgi:hypothetical protein
VVHFAPDLADIEPSVLSPQFLRPPSARGHGRPCRRAPSVIFGGLQA